MPYHLDDYLPDLDTALAPGVILTVDLSDGDPWARMAELYELVAKSIRVAILAGAQPVVMSGDCTTSLGTIAGLQRGGIDPAVVWFDGHGDLQTPETTTSGYLGGMPLRMLVGYRPEVIAQPLGLRPVPESRVLLVGARDLDPPERDFLAGSAIRRCDVEDVSADLLPPGPIYLHVDVDVVDPDALPGLLFPAPGGPSLEAVFAAIGTVLASGRVAALGIGCTWHPGRGAGETVRPHFEAVLSGDTWPGG